MIDIFPVGDRADDTVRSTIKALMGGRDIAVEIIAPAVGMTVATFYRRLAGNGAQQVFRAGEVASIARYLRVDVSKIYGGLGGTLVPPPTNDGSSLPRLDSNQEPSGLGSLQVSALLATAA